MVIVRLAPLYWDTASGHKIPVITNGQRGVSGHWTLDLGRGTDWRSLRSVHGLKGGGGVLSESAQERLVVHISVIVLSMDNWYRHPSYQPVRVAVQCNTYQVLFPQASEAQHQPQQSSTAIAATGGKGAKVHALSKVSRMQNLQRSTLGPSNWTAVSRVPQRLTQKSRQPG